MSKEHLISDEQIGAFADGELEAEEENRIFTLAEKCPELDARLCQQRKLKKLVQHAYRDIPQSRRRNSRGGRGGGLFSLAAAALLLLAVGVAAGWFSARTAGVANQAPSAVSAITQDAWLLHVASSDPGRMQEALSRAEELMNGPGASAQRRVEIVANEGGLDLLRSDVTPFGEQIRVLADQHVLFFACSRAIERLEERGIDVRLVPEANTAFSALDRVVLRMQQGWTYVKI